MVGATDPVRPSGIRLSPSLSEAPGQQGVGQRLGLHLVHRDLKPVFAGVAAAGEIRDGAYHLMPTASQQ